MKLEGLDYLVIIIFSILTLAIGIGFRKKAGKNLQNFFLGGKNLPWWIIGISMVATTFAADTPLAVTELVHQGGISANWLWWNMLAGGMLTTFFFARYWRRANVLTDLELIEMRYSGKAASFLRVFRSIYFGVFMNTMIIGWVNVALMALLKGFFNIEDHLLIYYVALAMVFVMAYSAVSGLLGVVYTDLIQFVIAMTGCIILAIIVLNSEKIGGIDGLKEKLPEETFQFFPKINTKNNAFASSNMLIISVGSFLALVTLSWWASWYPGNEPGGGGYIAQRMLSAKNERHAVFGTLFFQIGHYCLRPWPWVIVGICAIYLYSLNYQVDSTLAKKLDESIAGTSIGYDIFSLNEQELLEKAKTNPDIKRKLPQIKSVIIDLQKEKDRNVTIEKAMIYHKNPGQGYVMVMKDFLPKGLKGLLLVAFFAAYMSTISTQLNWGSSYLVNDLYKKSIRPTHSFVNPEKAEKRYILMSRVFTLLIMVIALMVTTQINSISSVWSFIIECGAGLGLVMILRWYWWRINAWSEIVATIAPFIAYGFSKLYLTTLDPAWSKGVHQDPRSFLFTLSFTTIAWIIATFVTKPTAKNTLVSFYNKIKPAGNWKGFSTEKEKTSLGLLLVCWISAIAMAYALLFATGSFIFKNWENFWLYFLTMIFSLIILIFVSKKIKLFD